jgi:hypothetical protein
MKKFCMNITYGYHVCGISKGNSVIDHMKPDMIMLTLQVKGKVDLGA